MAKVQHIRARKEIPSIGVKPGDMYYKVKLRSGNGSVKRVSKTPFRPSQLTLSAFLSAWRGFSEQIEDLALDDDLYDNLQSLAGEMRALGEEQTASRENMPDGLQNSPTGELLETRANNCETWADAIEQLDKPDIPDEEAVRAAVDRMEAESDEDYVQRQDDAWEAAQEAYEEELRQLRDDALAEDPGEE